MVEDSHRTDDSQIDIIVATITRTAALARFLDALRDQTFMNFRVIVVDQNVDDRLEPIIQNQALSLTIIHLRSAPGLSHARNEGIRNIEGSIVTFADDDCWYPPDLLFRVAALMRTHPDWAGVTGRITDPAGTPSSARWSSRAGTVSRRNVWTRGASASIFLRASVIHAVGLFDESLGLGSGTDFGSGEDTDYLIRVLDDGYMLRYEPSLAVIHEDNRAVFDDRTILAGNRYGAGMGRVCGCTIRRGLSPTTSPGRSWVQRSPRRVGAPAKRSFTWRSPGVVRVAGAHRSPSHHGEA